MKNASTDGSVRTGRFVRSIVAAVAAILCLDGHTTASAGIISEVTGCVGLRCTIEPVGGPVNLDPVGFTLDVEWSQILHFFNDSGGHGFMTLHFDYTGTHDGTEFFGTISFQDPSGNPIPGLLGGFDDTSVGAGTFDARFEVFGPESLLGGFTLGLSDGSGVDTLHWTSASILPSQVEAVPEPSALLLLGAGLAAATWKRRRQDASQRMQRSRVLKAGPEGQFRRTLAY